MRIWEEVAGRCLHRKPEIVFKVRSADRTVNSLAILTP